MVAEKGNERSGRALSALVRAMERRRQVAVLLFVPRVSEATGANAATCVARPLLARRSPPSLPASCACWSSSQEPPCPNHNFR